MGRFSYSLLSVVCLGFLLAARCGSPSQPGPTDCGGTPRQAIDCTSEIQYQGVKAAGSTSVLSFAAAQGSYEEGAIREINPLIASYVVAQTRLCRDYNACVVSAETYHAESSKLSEKLMPVTQAAAQWDGASYGARKKLLDQIYQSVAPPEQRQQALEFQLVVRSTLPGSQGGRSFVLRPGEPLPTGASLAFEFRVSTSAHVYMFQRHQSDKVDVLFPSPDAGVANPLEAGVNVRIPARGAYVVDANDLGLEHVYLVVSKLPLQNLNGALERVRNNQVESMQADPALSSLSKVAPGTAPADCATRALKLDVNANAPGATSCARSRGLVLDTGAGSEATSMVVRTDVGDDTIVKAFPFEHVTPTAYDAAKRAYDAPTPDGEHKRGIIMEK